MKVGSYCVSKYLFTELFHVGDPKYACAVYYYAHSLN